MDTDTDTDTITNGIVNKPPTTTEDVAESAYDRRYDTVR
jgi:hypothetical protein